MRSTFCGKLLTDDPHGISLFCKTRKDSLSAGWCINNMKFSHLHNHTQFSLLDGASNISKLFDKARKDGMPAMAITDHGNMFGVFDFVAEASNFPTIFIP